MSCVQPEIYRLTHKAAEYFVAIGQYVGILISVGLLFPAIEKYI